MHSTARSTAAPTRAWRAVVAGRATPYRLMRLAAVLAGACMVTALVSVLAGSVRTDAVGAGGTRTAALNTDLAQLYRSLNEADAMATSGFAADGAAAAVARARYDDHVARATQRLVHAASLLPPGGPEAASAEVVTSALARYVMLIETARALGDDAALDRASQLMRATILPAADSLRRSPEASLATAYREAGSFPTTVLLLLAATLLGVAFVGVRERRRTNRILNLGLLAAAVLLTAALLWWLVATFAASGRLEAAQRHNDVVAALGEARIAALQARAAETMAVVDRSVGDAEGTFRMQLDRTLGAGGLLDVAAEHAADDEAARRVAAVRDAAIAWREANAALRALEQRGDHDAALASAVGADPLGSRAAFDRLSAALADAVGAERTALAIDVRGADSALTGLAEGPAVLGVLAAAGVVVGIGQRVREYR
jgi:hypothetical protein